MAAISSISDPGVPSTSRLRAQEDHGKGVGAPSWSGEGCSAVMEKTQDFFRICDIEDKGFITRRDMQRLHGELPLSADELENVFDTLDADSNGYLTLQEFSSGFSEFMFGAGVSGSKRPEVASCCQGSAVEAASDSRWEEPPAVGGAEEEEHFGMLMESLGANNVFEDPGEVRRLWAQLQKDEPHLLSNFEEFLARVTVQIKEATQEKKEMESALKRKAATHDYEIQRLYEEMEQQIRNEKERIISQDSERFLTHSQALEQQLGSKEKELEQLSTKQRKLEWQCKELHSEQQAVRGQNVRLKQTNADLLRELERTGQELQLAQEQLGLLQEQSSLLQEEREMEMYRVTEGLQRERASLLRQLDLLREMNKHLRDERDMCYQKPKSAVDPVLWTKPRSGSVMEAYVERKQPAKSEDEEAVPPHSKRKTVNGHGVPVGPADQSDGGAVDRRRLRRIISIEEDHLPQLLQQEYQAQLQELSEEEGGGEEEEEDEEGVELQMSSIYPVTSTPIPHTPHPATESRDTQTPTSPRGQPVGKETTQTEEGVSCAPDRLFKVVLVGNSSVGKTSLLRRFCDGCFYPGTSATVGIDYSVKTLTVDGSQVALQMWDTAGQERYRSITKQFFRKADGVVVMYDITAGPSFAAVRQWLANVQEGAGDNIPIMLLGNKTDLDGRREVQQNMGERLAKDSKLGFFECSAFSGHNVTEAMMHLARILKEQEDREKEKTVSLVASPARKRSCC